MILCTKQSILYGDRIIKPSSGGSRISRGRGEPIMWPNFPENCMKMKKIGPGAHVQNLLCRSATAYSVQGCQKTGKTVDSDVHFSRQGNTGDFTRNKDNVVKVSQWRLRARAGASKILGQKQTKQPLSVCIMFWNFVKAFWKVY